MAQLPFGGTVGGRYGKFTTLSVDDGTALLPSLAFASDPSTGFCLLSAGTIGVSSGGAEKWRFVGDTFRSKTGGGPSIENVTATGTTPVFNPNQGDKKTGLGWGGLNNLSLIANNIEVLRVADTGDIPKAVINGRLLVGSSTGNIPSGPLEVVGAPPGSVGGAPAGELQVRDTSTSANAGAVITGHNSFSGNTQVWYFGSTSSSNQHIALINRMNAELQFWTNNTQRFKIRPGGGVDIVGVGGAFKMPVMTTTQRNAFTKESGMIIYNISTDKFQGVEANAWVDLSV